MYVSVYYSEENKCKFEIKKRLNRILNDSERFGIISAILN